MTAKPRAEDAPLRKYLIARERVLMHQISRWKALLRVRERELEQVRNQTK
jgi:hypothetical protein